MLPFNNIHNTFPRKKSCCHSTASPKTFSLWSVRTLSKNDTRGDDLCFWLFIRVKINAKVMFAQTWLTCLRKHFLIFPYGSHGCANTCLTWLNDWIDDIQCNIRMLLAWVVYVSDKYAHMAYFLFLSIFPVWSFLKKDLKKFCNFQYSPLVLCVCVSVCEWVWLCVSVCECV